MQVHIDAHDPTSPISKEVDFFDQHTDDIPESDTPIIDSQRLSEPQPIQQNGNGSATRSQPTPIGASY